MKEVSKQNFGLVIAYLLPGLVALWGASYFSNTVQTWLKTGDQVPPTIAGFLYVTLAAFTTGLTLGAIRTVTIDVFHHHTGVVPPEWDFSDFQAKFWAFNQLVESHYCLYQFYAHMCLALPAVVAARLFTASDGVNRALLAAFGLLEAVLLVVSRGTLKSYYAKVSQLLGTDKAELVVARRMEVRESRLEQKKANEGTLPLESGSERTPDRAATKKVARW